MVNTAPFIDNFGPAVSLLEQQFGHLDVDSDFLAVDAELDALLGGAGDWNGASLDIARAGGANADDLFGFDFGPGFSILGNEIHAVGFPIATFTSGGGVLHIDFTEGCFTQEIRDVLRAITYQNTSDNPPSTPYDVDFVLSDGDPLGALSSTHTLTISIVPQNDLPSVTGGLSAFVDEGAAYTITAADLNYFDSDNPPSDITFSIYPAASLNGTLLVNGIAATTFTPADIDAGLVQFQHDGSESNFASFVVSVEDLEDQAFPLAHTFYLNVNPTNEPPTLTGSLEATLQPDTQMQLTTDMVFGSDDDNDPFSLTFAVSNLQHVMLFNLNDPTTPISTFTAADLSGGLIFVRHDGLSGPVGFDIAVEDGDEDGSTPVSQPFTVTLDTFATPSIPDLDDADDTGVVGDNVTAQTTDLTFSATSTIEGYAVSFFDDLRLDGTDNDGDGSVDEADERTFLGEAFDSGGGVYVLDNVSLSAGTHHIRSRLGSLLDDGPSLDVLTVVVDPDVENLDLAAADDTGLSSTDNVTAQATGLTITGDTDAAAGETVTLYSVVDLSANGVDDDSDGTIDEAGEYSAAVLGSGLTDASGGFSIDIALPEGVTAIAGQLGTGPLSSTIPVTVDTTAPVLNAFVMGDGRIAIAADGEFGLFGLPESGDFTVMVDGNPATVASATAEEGSIILTLAAPVQEGQSVEFAYDAAAGAPDSIADRAGNTAASVALAPIPNHSTLDVTPPSLIYAAVGAGGQGIVLLWDDNVAASDFEPGDFSILINGVATSPIAAQRGVDFGLSAYTIVLQFDPAIDEANDSLGPVIYTAGAGTPDSIRDEAGNPAGDQSIALSPNTPPSWDLSSYAVTVSEADFTDHMVVVPDGIGFEVVYQFAGALILPVGYVDPDPLAVASLGFALTGATWDPLDGPPQAFPASSSLFVEPAFGYYWVVEGGPSAYEFLSYGETLVLQFTATVNDLHPGGVDTMPVTITIEGVNTQIAGTVFDDLTLNGTTGGDDIRALNGDDLVNGGSGHDRIWGDDGDDRLNGGSGIDTLFGGAGQDDIDGGSGNDRLYGDAGNDRLTGGSGSDWFIYLGDGFNGFEFAGGNDIVHDFAIGEDQIGLDGILGVHTFADLDIDYANGNAYITFHTSSGPQVITLEHIDGVTEVLSAGDFQITGGTGNHAPVNTVPGAQSATEDIALAINGISVADADGDPLSVTLHVDSGRLSAAAAGGAVLSGSGTANLSISGSAAAVNATLASLGYLGNLNFFGTDQLTLTTSDNHFGSAVSHIAIDVAPVNDLPTIGVAATPDLSDGNRVLIDNAVFSATDIEDGGNLTYHVANVTGGDLRTAGGVPVTSFTGAQLNGSGIYFHDDGVAGTVAGFDVVATDTQGGTSPSVHVAVNMAPAYAGDGQVTVTDGGITTVTGADLRAVDPDTAPADLTYHVIGQSNGQVLVGVAPAATFTEAQLLAGLVSFAHDGSGSDGSFTVVLADQTQGAGPRTVQVVLDTGSGNHAPLLGAALTDRLAIEGVPFSFTVPGTTFIDPDHDPLMLAASLASGAPLPGWLSFDPLTGLFSGTPGFSDAGSLDIRVTATDPSLAAVDDVFTLTVADDTNPNTAIETVAATDLIRIGANFHLYGHGTASGPALSFGGAPVIAGQFGGWTPVGAERTASGFAVVWQHSPSGMFSVWNTDAGGNYVGNALYAVAGSNEALQTFETVFQQDLNGDGHIGLPTSPIETAAATDLTQVGSQFHLYGHDSASGPVLSFGGAAVVDGQFGGWTPVGAERTASGYAVAWQHDPSGMFSVWNTDAGGNYVGNALYAVAGSNEALQTFEEVFQQDLNGDGAIGVPLAAPPQAPAPFGGDDIVEVGTGSGTVYGGSGADRFVFDAVEMAAAIGDFSAAEGDTLVFDAALFGGGLAAGGTLGDFAANPAGIGPQLVVDHDPLAAAVGQPAFLYDSDGGQLYWDADGNGGGTAVQLTTLTDHPSLAVDDFRFV